MMTGDLVTIVDSDDFIDPYCFESMLTISPHEDLYCINAQKYDLENNTYMEKASSFNYSTIITAGKNQKDIIEFDLFSNGFAWSKIFKTEIIKKNHILFDTRLKHNDDHVFTFKYLLHRNTIAVRSRIGYYWLMRNESLSYDINHF